MKTTTTQPLNKQAAKRKIAAMSKAESWQHLEQLAAAAKTRPLTPQEKLETLKCWFGSDTESLG